VVAKIRERIAVNKQGSHTFHMERFNLKKLIDVEGKEKYCVEVSNRFAALEDLDAEVEINTFWETIRENIKISEKESLGYYELKQHKPWLDEGCSELLYQRKQAKPQWLRDPSEINGDNLRIVRHETSRHFRNKKRE
jgi:lipoate-protein ligase A